MKYIRLYESFRMINEQQGQIYKRPKDPYEYKVEDDNWLSRKKGTTKWYNITGGDFKPAYQKSIDMLDKEFPKARTEEAPKRGGEATPKEAAPKEVEYTRDNGETAKGTIVDVDKEKETVTVKAPSGKEFEKPFDKVEMASDELKKLAETPPPAENKKEEKPAEEKKEEPTPQPKQENQKKDESIPQRLLRASQDNPPKGLKQFFLADDKALEYIKDEGADLSANGKTYIFPFPPEDKEEFVYLSGYNPDEEKIGRMYVGSIGPATDIVTFDGKEQLQDAIDTLMDMKLKIIPVKSKVTNSSEKSAPGGVDAEARAKSKARDEAQDNITTSKSGSKVTK